jgi:hypothetical protein
VYVASPEADPGLVTAAFDRSSADNSRCAAVSAYYAAAATAGST